MNSPEVETSERPHPVDGSAGVLLVLLVAVAVRALYLAQVRHLILFTEATGDSARYLDLARAVRADGWMAPLGQPWFQAPFYPWYLALTSGAGADLFLPRLLQSAAGALGTLLVLDTTRRLAGPRAGFWAGLIAALYAPAIFFEGELLSIAWAVFFMLLAVREMVILRTGGGARHAALSGLLFAIAALAQPNILLVPAVVAIFLAASALRARDRSFKDAAVFVAGVLLVLAPAVWRNRVQTGEWIVLSANGGVNFFIGNNPAADGSFQLPPGEPLLNRSEGLEISAASAAAAALGRPVGASEASAYWFRRGLAAWSADPAGQLGLLARKTLLFLNGTELPNHYDIRFFRARVPILRLLPGFLLLLPLAAWGVLTLRKTPAVRAVLVAGAAYAASVILFFITDRYRLPVIVALLPLAGAGLDRLIATVRAREPRPILAGSVVVILFLVLGGFPLMDTRFALAHMHNIVGTLYYRNNELGAARQEFQRAEEIAPGSNDALNNLGRIALLSGRIDEAEAFFRKAIAADNRLPEAWFNLEELDRNRGRSRQALQTLEALERSVPGARAGFGPAIDYRRGANHLVVGDTTAALAEFRAAVAAKPDLAAAWAGIGTIQGARGDFDAAWKSFSEAVRLAPDYFGDQYNLGLVAEKRGDYSAARTAYTRALELKPDDPEVRKRITAALSRLPSPAGRP